MTRMDGAYEASRAASLAGVPVSTVYYWARKGIWPPAAPNGRPMLWSYSDLLALRLINWLRQAKPDFSLPATRMAEIRRLLGSVQDMGDELRHDSVRVWIESNGTVLLEAAGEFSRPLGMGLKQPVLMHDPFSLVAAVDFKGIKGPDLIEPRPSLRIVPGKLSSEVHVIGTRVSSQMIRAICQRNIDVDGVLTLYPFLTAENVNEALSLEEQLAHNLAA